MHGQPFFNKSGFIDSERFVLLISSLLYLLFLQVLCHLQTVSVTPFLIIAKRCKNVVLKISFNNSSAFSILHLNLSIKMISCFEEKKPSLTPSIKIHMIPSHSSSRTGYCNMKLTTEAHMNGHIVLHLFSTP